MKKVFKSNENPILEIAKRIIYSFQVLIVGIALPFLFLIGISTTNENKSQVPEVKEINNTTQAQASLKTVDFLMPRI